MHHFFAYMARMRFIDRWALMRNSYTENIQEHSHQVAILAHALAVLRNAARPTLTAARRRRCSTTRPKF